MGQSKTIHLVLTWHIHDFTVSEIKHKLQLPCDLEHKVYQLYQRWKGWQKEPFRQT